MEASAENFPGVAEGGYQLRRTFLKFSQKIVVARKVGPCYFLRLNRAMLERFSKNDIIEARVSRVSGEGSYRVYTHAGYANPHLNISFLRPVGGEPFQLHSLRAYTISDFIVAFRRLRPRAFRNVSFVESTGSVQIKVDHVAAELAQPRLRARGQGPILEGVLGHHSGRGGIRIAQEGGTFVFHFRDFSTNHPRIIRMKAVDSHVEVDYMQSSLEAEHRTRRILATAIEPVRRVHRESRFAGVDSSNMTRKEIRAWIDTEGNLYVRGPTPNSGPQLSVTQKERRPLDIFARSVQDLGIRCKVTKDGRNACFVAKITDIESIARTISEVGPFRTSRKQEQVRKFIAMLGSPRMERRRVVERARRWLCL